MNGLQSVVVEMRRWLKRCDEIKQERGVDNKMGGMVGSGAEVVVVVAVLTHKAGMTKAGNNAWAETEEAST